MATVVEAAAVQEAEVGLVAASGGQVLGAPPAEEEAPLGGSAVTVGPGQASDRSADVGAPMRRARPAGVEWHDVVPDVSSARNKRTAPSAENGPPNGRRGLVVQNPSDPPA